MRKLLMILMVTMFSIFLAGSAMAIPNVGDLTVDFRTWGGANNQASWTVGNVTATALPTGSLLSQDGTDGLGVLSGEPDEIDLIESISVAFSGGMNLAGVWITDLFGPSDGNTASGEYGSVTINGGNPIVFFGINSDQGNGEQYIDFGGILVNNALFKIEGATTNNEFSVAGFVAVPEPTTMLLLGFGLFGLAGVSRKFKK